MQSCRLEVIPVDCRQIPRFWPRRLFFLVGQRFSVYTVCVCGLNRRCHTNSSTSTNPTRSGIWAVIAGSANLAQDFDLLITTAEQKYQAYVVSMLYTGTSVHPSQDGTNQENRPRSPQSKRKFFQVQHGVLRTSSAHCSQVGEEA
jgi:hypothetical protein